MSKIKRVNLSGLNAEERQALADWVRDFKQAAPKIKEAQQTAHDMFVGLLQAPEWYLHEGINKPENLPSQNWNIGAPQVNYVDHIEPIGRQDDSAEHPTDR